MIVTNLQNSSITNAYNNGYSAGIVAGSTTYINNLPDSLVYIGTAHACRPDVNYAVVSYVPYIFEGYSQVRIHFDYTRVSAVHNVRIIINGNDVYFGSDYSDKYYTVTTGSCIEAYTVVTTATCDSSSPSAMTATITVYK